MYEAIPEPRKNLSKYAPIIKLTSVPVDKIGELIGPGGKNVKALSEEYGVEIQIEENGSVKIVGNNDENVNKAMVYIANMSKEIKQGERFMATVSRVEKYGFFAEIVPGRTGLVHISKMGRHVKNVADVVHIGDKVNVEITGFDPSGKLQLRQIIENSEDQTNEDGDEVRDHDKRRWNNGGEGKR
jgi:polyribonucleotide nucleotidyltransferase